MLVVENVNPLLKNAQNVKRESKETKYPLVIAKLDTMTKKELVKTVTSVLTTVNNGKLFILQGFLLIYFLIIA